MPLTRRAFALGLVASLALAPAPAGAFGLRDLFKGGGRKLDARPVAIDEAEAARMISAYRSAKGLKPLKLDARLARIAADHALRMASADKVSHVLRGEGSFARRLSAGGYDAAVASENIGAGYDSIAEAVAGWKKSREHDKNMLRADLTVMGIARADAAGSKYGTYWSLVMARPYEGPPPGAGPDAGPIVGIRP